MATITFKGNPIQTAGELPTSGAQSQDFKLVRTDLAEVSLGDYSGTKKILNIFPSVDTGICAASVRNFNAQAGAKDGVVVLNISADLPFAHTRFCGAEGLEGVQSLSTFRSDFGQAWGLTMTEGPLAGLLSRAVIVLDEENRVLYTEQVAEIAQEPNYDAALAAL